MATSKRSLLDAFERNKYDFSALKKSKTWLNQQVMLLGRQRITPNQILLRNPQEMRSRIIPGNCYLFAYDPKLKAELPYYDRFPLVFPYRAIPGGFMGLNFHYLDYGIRIKLLDNLLDFINNDKMDGNTRLKYSWDTIKGISRYAPAKACIKHYLNDHVMSDFRKIHATDWVTAMLLPVERFSGATKEQVWKDSRRKM